MTVDPNLFDSVCESARRAALFLSAADALEWDERTGMPHPAGEYRAEQISLLRSHSHQVRTAPEFGEKLEQLSEQIEAMDAHDDRAATVRMLARDFRRDRKLPVDLVSRISKATSRGQQAWDSARKQDSFDQFKAPLQEIIALKREEASRLAEGETGTDYDALLDEFEPGTSVNQLSPVFDDLKTRLSDLVAQIADAKTRPDIGLLQQSFPIEKQRALSRDVAAAVGFDFQRGRLDETSHPFCTTLGPHDCRILTRFEKNWLPSGLYGTLHEAGHGMYEQGLRTEWFGLPPGMFVSLGIHESQSRLWENQVGRSPAFCRWLFPKLRDVFPDQFSTADETSLYGALNHVRPSLIRVEADEATYNLHILIRFELEQQLIAGLLSVDDLPEAWNAQYQECLGITPPSDADGVLQDVHWSAGLFGYFPTYTLGNLAAAQLFEAAAREIPELEQQFERGEFGVLLQWLREKVHRPGRCFTGNELIENATGSPLSADPLLDYLQAKLKPLYGLA